MANVFALTIAQPGSTNVLGADQNAERTSLVQALQDLIEEIGKLPPITSGGTTTISVRSRDTSRTLLGTATIGANVTWK
jgi:hypothetical protein